MFAVARDGGSAVRSAERSAGRRKWTKSRARDASVGDRVGRGNLKAHGGIRIVYGNKCSRELENDAHHDCEKRRFTSEGRPRRHVRGKHARPPSARNVVLRRPFGNATQRASRLSPPVGFPFWELDADRRRRLRETDLSRPPSARNVVLRRPFGNATQRASRLSPPVGFPFWELDADRRRRLRETDFARTAGTYVENLLGRLFHETSFSGDRSARNPKGLLPPLPPRQRWTCKLVFRSEKTWRFRGNFDTSGGAAISVVFHTPWRTFRDAPTFVRRTPGLVRLQVPCFLTRVNPVRSFSDVCAPVVGSTKTKKS